VLLRLYANFGAYDTTTNTWNSIANLGGVSRHESTSFSIGNFSYVTTGQDSNSNLLNDLWQYGVTTGLEELHQSSINISLFPNPNNGNMNILFDGNVQKGEIRIIDLLGRELDTRELTGSSEHIVLNETNLSEGMYYYQVINSGKPVSSGKFIIQK